MPVRRRGTVELSVEIFKRSRPHHRHFRTFLKFSESTSVHNNTLGTLGDHAIYKLMLYLLLLLRIVSPSSSTKYHAAICSFANFFWLCQWKAMTNWRTDMRCCYFSWIIHKCTSNHNSSGCFGYKQVKTSALCDLRTGCYFYVTDLNIDGPINRSV